MSKTLLEVTFPGGKRVDAKIGKFTIKTDQPVWSGGEGSARMVRRRGVSS